MSDILGIKWGRGRGKKQEFFYPYGYGAGKGLFYINFRTSKDNIYY